MRVRICGRELSATRGAINGSCSTRPAAPSQPSPLLEPGKASLHGTLLTPPWKATKEYNMRRRLLCTAASARSDSDVFARRMGARAAVRRSRRIAEHTRLAEAASTSELPAAGWSQWMDETTEELSGRKLLRTLRTLSPVAGSSTSVKASPSAVQGEGYWPAPGTRLDIFAANDYLGLSAHPEVCAAAAAAASEYGSGPRSSALVCGYTDAHAALESSLAAIKGSEVALLYPTGFAANSAVIGTLASSSECAIFSDALNHASIVDGARLASKGAGAALHIYRHNDLRHLEKVGPWRTAFKPWIRENDRVLGLGLA